MDTSKIARQEQQQFPWISQMPSDVLEAKVEITEIDKSFLRGILESSNYDGYEGYNHSNQSLYIVRSGKLQKVDIKKTISHKGQPSLIREHHEEGMPIYTALKGDEEFVVVLSENNDSGIYMGKLKICTIPKNITLTKLIEECSEI